MTDRSDELTFSAPVRVFLPEGIGLIRTVEQAIDWVNELLDGNMPTELAAAFRLTNEQLYAANDTRTAANVTAARAALEDAVERLARHRRKNG